MADVRDISREKSVPVKPPESVLLETIGTRIRRARVLSKMSRRALSEHCGVSQRYLAQLESGMGNVSILLLYRVAQALNKNLTHFVAVENDPGCEIAGLLDTADPDQVASILKILKPQPQTTASPRRYAFIGLRGAGKSTLGRLSSERMELPFVELNSEIEKVSGIPVHEVMALYGNEGYRKLELQSLKRLIGERKNFVLAVAGGIVTAPETFRLLLQNTFTIWLQASPQEHMSRVRGQGDERPMAGNPDAMRELRNILATREKSYGKADLIVDTSGKNIGECLDEILNGVEIRAAQ